MESKYDYRSIPDCIKGLRQWVLWKSDKAPYQVNGKRASTSDSSTWSDFDEALDVYIGADGEYAGIGFVFTKESGIVGIDIDHCIDDCSYTLTAKNIIKICGSYTEISQSGAGVHILIKAQKNFDKCKVPSEHTIEIYDSGRFFAITGDVLDDGAEIAEAQDALDFIGFKYFSSKTGEASDAPEQHEELESILSDDEVIERIKKRRFGTDRDRQIYALWNGDISSCNNDDSSADISLCNALAFWTRKNAKQMDSIFRKSKLYRDKWDEKHGSCTYGEMTIAKAIASTNKVYNPISEALQKNSTRGFDHDALAIEMIESEHIVFWGGKPFLYLDGYYQEADDELKLRIASRWSWLKKAQIDEVIERIRLYTYLDAKKHKINKTIINVNNGRVNLENGELLSHTFEDIDFCRVPIFYNPDALSPALDKFLSDIFVGDQEVLMLFEELMGYCLMKENKYATMFIFYGEGRNGKSSLMALIRKFLGADNVTHLGLTEMLNRFSTASLDRKLAVIGSDLNYQKIDKEINGKLKSIVAGDIVTVEKKHKDEYDMIPYATPIFSTNRLPKTEDTSEGMMERLCFIPCKAKFVKGTRGFNESIIDTITTEESLSALMNKAIAGYQRLVKNHGFTEPKIVTAEKLKYQRENDTVLDWLKSDNIDAKTLKTKMRAVSFYKMYDVWCRDSSEIPLKRNEFYASIKRLCHLKVSEKDSRGEDGKGTYFVDDI